MGSKKQDIERQLDALVRALPWRCKEHPDAQIRHSYDKTTHYWNGYAEPFPSKFNHKYECYDCGLELKAP